MTFGEKIALMLPGKKFVRLPVISLERDKSKVIVPRRRHDCARLYSCEDVWIAAYGGAQAKCPDLCSRFVLKG